MKGDYLKVAACTFFFVHVSMFCGVVFLSVENMWVWKACALFMQWYSKCTT